MKALLFDFGGTLDTNGIHWSEKFWDVYQRCRAPITKADFERGYVAAESRMEATVITPHDTLLHTLEKQVDYQFAALKSYGVFGNPIAAEDLAPRIARECFRDVCETINRIRPLLSACRHRYQVGLVSNFYGNLEAVCKELGIAGLFDAIVDSAVVGVRKPNPQIFTYALGKLGVKADESLVIGDSYERDIVPAKSIGCTTVWLRGRSWRLPSDTPAADYVIHAVSDISSFLRTAKHAVTL